MSLVWDVPVDIGRDEAAAAARDELAKPVYAAHAPSPLLRLLDRLWDFVAGLLDRAVAAAPGGALGLVGAALVVALVVALVLWRVGPVRRTATAERQVFVGRARTAAEYRSAADAAATAGRWEEAVRQRFRAIVRTLEERDALDERPGRTADEAAADAARVLPGSAAELVAAARTFDDVAYGGRRVDRAADDRLRELDRAVLRAPLRVVASAP